MNETLNIIIVLAAGGIIGGGIAWWLLRRAGNPDAEQTAEEQTDEQKRLQEQWLDQLSDKFKALSAEALSKNNRDFLQLAEQAFKNLHDKSAANLQERQQAIQALLNPLREALEKTNQHVSTLEQKREKAYGALEKHIELTAQAQNELRQETGKLVQALTQPQVRGRWGELTLHRLAELAGMVEYCDFEEQLHTTGNDDRALRPDMVVHLPNERLIVIDAKTPLTAYLEALETDNDTTRDQALLKHAQNISIQVKKLAEKSYWQSFDNTLDFVVLFIPGDQFLSAALKQRPDLMETAMNKRIILATPSSLVALLRTVAFGWQEKALSENAAAIQKLGAELYERVAVFNDHFIDVGKHLDRSVKKYNEASRSLETRLLASTRKFNSLGVHTSKALGEISSIETMAQLPERSEGETSDD